MHPEGGTDLATPDGLVVDRDKPIRLYVPTSDDGFVPPPPPETIPNPNIGGSTLTVRNTTGHAVVAFLEHGPLDSRVGKVPARGSESFKLPSALPEGGASVDIFLHVEGGHDLESTRFEIGPDAHLVVKVPA